MSRDQGSGIPRWVTIANLLAIAISLAVVIPQQSRATHTAPPEGLTVIARLSPTTPKLVWRDASQGLSQGYILQRSTTSDFSSGVVEIRIARNTLDFVDETLTFNKTFYYRVASITGTDRSGYSNVAVAGNGSGTGPGKPAAPDEITLATEGSGLRIRWRNNANNEYGVWVQRSADNGTTWEFRASLSLNSSQYFDGDPPPGAPTYRVWTFNSSGLSPSYAVQFVNAATPNPTVPGVPTVPGIPSLPAVPTQLIPTVPGVPTVPAVPTQLIPTVPGVPTVPAVPTQLIPTVPAVPDPNKLAYWIGVKDVNGAYLASLWLYPANCTGVTVAGGAGLGRCQPPPENQQNCAVVPFVTFYRYCTLFDSDPNT